MKKTISIHIKGLSFTIEEDAYELLQDYLDRLSNTFSKEAGGNEILEDIEIRIAELFNSRLNEAKTVIELQDVKEVLAVLGEPEQFATDDEEEEEESKSYKHAQEEKHTEKRLFRDEDNAAIGGVCAGIGNYFGIDPVVVRILFVLMLFAGFGFLLYIILWIAVPRTQNTIDRLRMKGRPITVENVKAEVENAAERIQRSSRSFTRKLNDREAHKRRISRTGRVLATILGVGLMAMGLVHLIAFLIFIVGGSQVIPVQSAHGFISITELGELVLSNSTDLKLAWIGGLMVSLSIILFLFTLGSLLLFRLRNRWIKLSLLSLVLTGLIGFFICFSVGVRTARDMAIEGATALELGSVQSNELTILTTGNEKNQSGRYEVISTDEFGLFTIDKDNLKSYGIRFEFENSADSAFHISQQFSARGHSHQAAMKKSEAIQHSASLQGDSLWIEADYSFPMKDKIRWQYVTIKVLVPPGGSVKLGDDVIYLSGGSRQSLRHPYYYSEGYLYSDGTYSQGSFW
jgi:phage shock protein PspC (stress-responsive transcriptional regulator)